MNYRKSLMPSVLCLLLFCEAMLFPLSWIISTAWQDSGVVSLLSPDGIRWFIGSHAKLLATPYIIWIILIGISAGILQGSKLTKPKKGFALQFTILVFLLQLAAIILLAFTPHAVLLSATGRLLGSSFSAGAIPMLCFVTCTCAITYGTLDSRYTTLRQLYLAALNGISMATPYILLYILVAQLYFSIGYILP